MQAPPGLLREKRGESHPTELADLNGKRFVATLETGRGEKLNEALVKQLSGGDPVKARRMREDFSEFDPTHHLWIATNHLPRADSSDRALFARLRVIPFRRRFLKPGDDGWDACNEAMRADDSLEGRILATEREGILAWMVRGYLRYLEVGAVPNPVASQEAIAAYRDENDPLAEWIEERCEIAGTDAKDRAHLDGLWKTRTGDLYGCYVGWKTRRNETPISENRFARTLTTKSFPEARRADGARARLGIRLRADQELPAEAAGPEGCPF